MKDELTMKVFFAAVTILSILSGIEQAHAGDFRPNQQTSLPFIIDQNICVASDSTADLDSDRHIETVFGKLPPVVTLVSETGPADDEPSHLIETVGFQCVEGGCLPNSSMNTLFGDSSQTWVVVAPYVWAPAMKGQVGAKGNVRNIDLSLSDLLDLLSDLNGAAMGHLEVGKGPRGLILDGMLMKLSPSGMGPAGETVNFKVNLTILEALGMYRLFDVDTGKSQFSHVSVDLLGGARYYQVGAGLTITPTMGPTLASEQSESWVDMVVGARGRVTVVTGLDAFVRADFAGFGMGTSSQLAWNFQTGIEYACKSCPGSSLVLGYKILDIDEKKGSGAEQFVFDAKLQGPFAAIAFRF